MAGRERVNEIRTGDGRVGLFRWVGSVDKRAPGEETDGFCDCRLEKTAKLRMQFTMGRKNLTKGEEHRQGFVLKA